VLEGGISYVCCIFAVFDEFVGWELFILAECGADKHEGL
jgi:hypothetical protein